jgi:predicted ATPase
LHIIDLSIKNFRGLDKVRFKPRKGLNVIAGPNAVGKTTILEAIRLAKSLLAQRLNGEAQNVLNGLAGNPSPILGANSQLMALAGNQNLPIEIEMILESV